MIPTNCNKIDPIDASQYLGVKSEYLRKIEKALFSLLDLVRAEGWIYKRWRITCHCRFIRFKRSENRASERRPSNTGSTLIWTIAQSFS